MLLTVLFYKSDARVSELTKRIKLYCSSSDHAVALGSRAGRQFKNNGVPTEFQAFLHVADRWARVKIR
jgi:hypothetical protein